MKRPAPQPRGDYRQILRALRLLRERPHTSEELADALGCSRRTAVRLVAVLAQEGEPVVKERSGERGWTYRLRG